MFPLCSLGCRLNSRRYLLLFARNAKNLLMCIKDTMKPLNEYQQIIQQANEKPLNIDAWENAEICFRTMCGDRGIKIIRYYNVDYVDRELMPKIEKYWTKFFSATACTSLQGDDLQHWFSWFRGHLKKLKEQHAIEQSQVRQKDQFMRV